MTANITPIEAIKEIEKILPELLTYSDKKDYIFEKIGNICTQALAPQEIYNKRCIYSIGNYCTQNMPQNCNGFSFDCGKQKSKEEFDKNVQFTITNGIAKGRILPPQECDVTKVDIHKLLDDIYYHRLTYEQIFAKVQQLHSQEKTFTVEEVRKFLNSKFTKCGDLCNEKCMNCEEARETDKKCIDCLLAEFEKAVDR